MIAQVDVSIRIDVGLWRRRSLRGPVANVVPVIVMGGSAAALRALAAASIAESESAEAFLGHDRRCVKIPGRAELPGRPLLYITTEKFLEHFNVKSVDELPNAAELRRAPLPSAEDVHKEEPAADATEEESETSDQSSTDNSEEPSQSEEMAESTESEETVNSGE